MIVRDYIMFKGSKLSAMDLMAKNLMIMIKSTQSIMAALRHARERGVDVFKSFTNEPENTGNSPIKTT